MNIEERQQFINRANQHPADPATAAPAAAPPPTAPPPTAPPPLQANPITAPPPGAAAPAAAPTATVRTNGDTVIRIIDENNPATQVTTRRRGNVHQRPAGPAQEGNRTVGARIVQPEAPGTRVRVQPQQGAYGATVVGATVVGGQPQTLGQTLRTPLGAPVTAPAPGGPGAPLPVAPHQPTAQPASPDMSAQIAAMAVTQAQQGTAVGPQSSAAQPAAATLDNLTVILSQHVRPDTLEHQYRALLAGGVPAGNIWCWVNPAGVRLNDGLLGNILHTKASQDLGPWMRWMLATSSRTKYVAVLDDDCTPGPRWLRNAIQRLESAERDGEPLIVAAAGGLYEADDHASLSLYGSESMHREEIFVDVGRGGWVMTTELARVVHAFPKYGSPLATPIHVATAAQKAGATIAVLPYPHNSREDWGMLTVPLTLTSMSARFDRAVSNGQDAKSADQHRKEDWQRYRHHEKTQWEPLCVLKSNATTTEEPIQDQSETSDDEDD